MGRKIYPHDAPRTEDAMLIAPNAMPTPADVEALSDYMLLTTYNGLVFSAGLPALERSLPRTAMIRRIVTLCDAIRSAAAAPKPCPLRSLSRISVPIAGVAWAPLAVRKARSG